MTSAAVTIDDKELKRRLKAIRQAAPKVLKKSARDASKQTVNQIAREVGKELNLRMYDIKSQMRVRQVNQTAESRISYKEVPAHRFPGWRYRQGNVNLRGRRRRNKVTRRGMTEEFVTFSRRGAGGLTVRFYKNRPPKTFRHAFRRPSLGGGVPFFMRDYPGSERTEGRPETSSPNLPVFAIKGPAPWSVVRGRFREHVEDGRIIYRRRMEYWLSREEAFRNR